MVIALLKWLQEVQMVQALQLMKALLELLQEVQMVKALQVVKALSQAQARGRPKHAGPLMEMRHKQHQRHLHHRRHLENTSLLIRALIEGLLHLRDLYNKGLTMALQA